jgi:hypothetical protein
VILHGPLADVEPCGNLRIRISFGRELEHLALARSEGFMRVERACLGLLNVSIDGDVSNRWTEGSSARE